MKTEELSKNAFIRAVVITLVLSGMLSFIWNATIGHILPQAVAAGEISDHINIVTAFAVLTMARIVYQYAKY